MCVVCGCGDENHSHEGAISGLDKDSAEFKTQPHHTDQMRSNLHADTTVRASALDQQKEGESRLIKLEMNILDSNQRIANQNRDHFKSHSVCALNLMSSPGAGKTTLLCATIKKLQLDLPSPQISVIEGDQQTDLDAARIRATGIEAYQVNTGKGCHLDAKMIAHAFSKLHTHHHHHDHGHHYHDHNHDHKHDHSDPTLDVHSASILFIENVGNLVCPALWDLGEHAKVVILSVTEGADKPLKYPDMFAVSDLMIINKIDLLAHVDFDVKLCVEFAKRINPKIKVIELSATTGVGMDLWIDWLRGEMKISPLERSIDPNHSIKVLEQRRHELERDLEKINKELAEITALK